MVDRGLPVPCAARGAAPGRPGPLRRSATLKTLYFATLTFSSIKKSKAYKLSSVHSLANGFLGNYLNGQAPRQRPALSRCPSTATGPQPPAGIDPRCYCPSQNKSNTRHLYEIAQKDFARQLGEDGLNSVPAVEQ